MRLIKQNNHVVAFIKNLPANATVAE